MKNFKISEQQIQQLWTTLIEFPAKSVLSSLDIIRNLQLLPDEKDNGVKTDANITD